MSKSVLWLERGEIPQVRWKHINNPSQESWWSRERIGKVAQFVRSVLIKLVNCAL